MKKYVRLYSKKKFLYPLSGFFAFFYIFDISTVFCLLFLDIILLDIILLYKKSRPSFFASVLSFTVSGCIAYFGVRYLQGYILRFPTIPEGILGFFAIIFIGTCLHCSFSSIEILHPADELFKEQKHDILRLRQYIMQFPLLGINARWGNGKSFIWAHLRNDPEIYKTFDIIQIDLLTVDLDAVELVLISELERLLENHQIHPNSSRHLRTLLSQNKWLHWINSLLNDGSDGLAASFTALQQDLKRIGKKVLIGFEDIDRISNTDQIKKFLL